MKQFNLDEYLDNPNRKVVTRDGKSVRIKCTDRKGVGYPIIALIDLNTIEDFYAFSKDGECWTGNETKYDLFFAPEKKEGWVNVYCQDNRYLCGNVYNTESEAHLHSRSSGYLATVKIEWEE